MRKVYTYKMITELREQDYYEELLSAPHIVATTNMQFAVNDFYSDIDYVMNIYPIQKIVIGSWLDTSVIMEQYINLSAIIRDMSNVSEREKPFYEAFVKGKKDVLNAIRSLVEAEVYPDDVKAESVEEKLFVEIWRKAEEIDPSYGIFRAEMDRCWSDEGYFWDKLSKYFPKIVCAQSIVFHGFYYITAIQERVFDLLENHGKKLIFLCGIDMQIPEIHKVWFDAFGQSGCFEPIEAWKQGTGRPGPAYQFGKIFSSVEDTSTPKNIRIIKYENEAAYISDLKRIEAEGYCIYSTDATKTEKILKEIFPEKFKKRHLLSYPVGQFFYTLHSLWSAEDRCIKLDIDQIQNCFSSGWVVYNKYNGREYTQTLELLRTYFEGCYTEPEWKKRICEYREIRRGLAYFFEKHIEDQPYATRRWHKVMSNPFLNFSCFSIGLDEVEILFSLIEKLIDTAKSLFGEGRNIDIATHFERIKELLHNGESEAAVYKEEHAIIEELAERMKMWNVGITTCLPEDISDAVMMIIGGGILDEDNYEILSSSDEHFVRSMFQIETAPIVAGGKIHLCMADENRLPGKEKKYPWPLCSKTLKRIANSIEGRRSQYIKDMMFVNEGALAASRYLFFSAIQNDDVEISWIADDNGKAIAESSYIRILRSVFGCEVTDYRKDDYANLSVSDLQVLHPLTSCVKTQNLVIPEVHMDLALCSWKYIYGYVVNRQPSYTEDFHYRFVLAAIIGAFSKITGYSLDTVADNVLPCFPYLSEVEKRQIRDYSTTTTSLDGTDSLDDVSYTRARLKPHFISNQRDFVHNIIDLVSQSEDESYLLNLYEEKGASYDVCMFCQYKSDCIYAIRERNDE